MIQRCTNPNHANFPTYGGRGIEVCPRWRTFTNFLEDMGQRPDAKSIDRIDGTKGYEPANCRWATAKEQRANVRPGSRMALRTDRRIRIRPPRKVPSQPQQRKLESHEPAQIRFLVGDGVPKKHIARFFGIDPKHVRDICDGKVWRTA